MAFNIYLPPSLPNLNKTHTTAPRHTVRNKKRHPLLGACLREKKQWSPSAELQRCLQKGYEGSGLQHGNLGGLCIKQIELHRSDWRSTLRMQLLAGENVLAEKRACRKDAVQTDKKPTVTVHTCSSCRRDCHSRIGLFSHRRRCTNPST